MREVQTKEKTFTLIIMMDGVPDSTGILSNYPHFTTLAVDQFSFMRIVQTVYLFWSQSFLYLIDQ